MTMSKLDSSDSVLVDNFTAGTGETATSHTKGDNNMTTAGGNSTTATDAGNENIVKSFAQNIITDGNNTGNATTGATDNMITPTGNETGNESATMVSRMLHETRSRNNEKPDNNYFWSGSRPK